MTPIAQAFSHPGTLAAFVPCGDPSLQTTLELLQALPAAGVDLIELGFPFSDPVGLSPVLEAADARALAGATTSDRIFSLLEGMQPQLTVPLIIRTYANVVYSYGIAAFCERAARAGVAGLALYDVPAEEQSEFADPARRAGLTLISTVTDISQERLESLAPAAEGFIHAVSLDPQAYRSLVARLRAATDTPVLVAADPATPAAGADGVLVDTALVQILARRAERCLPDVLDLIARVRRELDAAVPV